MLWGGGAIVVIAVAVIAFVAISPGGGNGVIDESLLMSGGSLVGEPDALVTIVEFGDFQ